MSKPSYCVTAHDGWNSSKGRFKRRYWKQHRSYKKVRDDISEYHNLEWIDMEVDAYISLYYEDE